MLLQSEMGAARRTAGVGPDGYHPAVPVDLAGVRAALPCLARETYLNTGGAGPLPLPAAEAIEEALRRALGRGRMGAAAAAQAEACEERARVALARVLGARGPDEVALAQSSTEAMTRVIWGIDWRPGDEAVTTGLEHPGLTVPLRTAARRLGVRLHVLALERGDEDLEAAVGTVAGPRTRLVALSHVAYGTGARMDVEGAARAARAVGALTLVDGAQGVGALPTDARVLGADAYAVPAQKWLLGPEGLGALWLAPEALERIDLTFSGFSSGTGHRPDGTLSLHPGARRLEVSTHPALLIPGWLAALGWLDGLGWPEVHAGVLAAAEAVRAALDEVPGVRVLTPPGDQAGLVTFTIAGHEPEAACQALAERGVIVRWLAHPAALRASAGFFTDGGDVERLAAAAAALTATGG
jgi:L-cysteine/cystine lyase